MNNPQATPPFYSLSNELIQHIATYLPLASAAVLTLCGRSLRQILGTRYTDRFLGVYGDKKERQIFLSLLAKDLPLQYACFHCLKLHPHDKPPSLSTRLLSKQKGRPCHRVDNEALRYLFAGRAITFSSIRTAILNRRCLPTPASLFFTNVLDHGCRISAKFKVVDGRLLMRADHRIPPLRQRKGLEQVREVRVYLCPHQTTSRDILENELVSTLGCAFNHTWRNSSGGDVVEKPDFCDNCAELRSWDTYGQTTALLVSTIFRNTADEYERVERVVLRGGDKEALAFRQSVTDECNMTAVAGAIIAQVAITALSLPNLSLAHWTARAFLLFAVVAGCLSVYYACKLQRTIGKLYQPVLIRDWLRIPPPEAKKEGEGEEDEIKASLPALFVLSAPFTMMAYSIFTFLLGLTIYQGFTWTRTLDPNAGKNDSRNVFITFVVGAGFCQAFFTTASTVKVIENILLPSRLQGVVFGVTGKRQAANRIQNRGGQGSGLGGRDQASRVVTDLEALQRKPTPSTDEIKVISHEALPMYKRQGVDELVIEGLAAALQAAADAHLLCAEADRQVAFEYAKLS
ncbi:MAG: hypothetical protein Q9187_005485 [Circinaria calcarea]